MTETDHDSVREQTRRRYAEAARDASEGRAACDCGSDGCVHVAGDRGWAEVMYDDGELGQLPAAAVLASLGCGNPTAVADLHPGETVLDLGSGGGIDVILSARRVAPGTAYGLDMTDEMLALAEANAAEAGVRNVKFLKGNIEAIPLPPNSVDVVISNCVINLSTDKPAVFAEMARVLRPGGRIGISDIVAENELSEERRALAGSVLGCTAGALSPNEYLAGLEAAGFGQVSVEFRYEAVEGLHGAIVRAEKPR